MREPDKTVDSEKDEELKLTFGQRYLGMCWAVFVGLVLSGSLYLLFTLILLGKYQVNALVLIGGVTLCFTMWMSLSNFSQEIIRRLRKRFGMLDENGITEFADLPKKDAELEKPFTVPLVELGVAQVFIRLTALMAVYVPFLVLILLLGSYLDRFGQMTSFLVTIGMLVLCAITYRVLHYRKMVRRVVMN
jgi:ABC-type polysaccharide/polyol phosphate export permease